MTQQLEMIYGHCDECGKFCSTRTGAKFYEQVSSSFWYPPVESQLYCRKCLGAMGKDQKK